MTRSRNIQMGPYFPESIVGYIFDNPERGREGERARENEERPVQKNVNK